MEEDIRNNTLPEDDNNSLEQLSGNDPQSILANRLADNSSLLAQVEEASSEGYPVFENKAASMANVSSDLKYLDPEVYYDVAGSSQSGANKYKNAVLGLGIGLYTGGIKAATSLIDAVKYLLPGRSFLQDDSASSGAFTVDGIVESHVDRITKWKEHNLQIYGRENIGMNHGFWAGAIDTIGETLGIIGHNVLASKGVSKLPIVGKALVAARSVAAFRAAMSVANAAIWAVQTSSINARDAAKQAFDRVLQETGDKTQALMVGNHVYAKNFNYQFLPSLLIGNVVDRAFARSIGRAIGNPLAMPVASSASSKVNRFTKGFVLGALANFTKEGVEEGVEEYISELAKVEGLALANIHTLFNWDNVLNSFVIGGLMGVAMGAFSGHGSHHQNRNDFNDTPANPAERFDENSDEVDNAISKKVGQETLDKSIVPQQDEQEEGDPNANPKDEDDWIQTNDNNNNKPTQPEQKQNSQPNINPQEENEAEPEYNKEEGTEDDLNAKPEDDTNNKPDNIDDNVNEDEDGNNKQSDNEEDHEDGLPKKKKVINEENETIINRNNKKIINEDNETVVNKKNKVINEEEPEHSGTKKNPNEQEQEPKAEPDKRKPEDDNKEMIPDEDKEKFPGDDKEQGDDGKIGLRKDEKNVLDHRNEAIRVRSEVHVSRYEDQIDKDLNGFGSVIATATEEQANTYFQKLADSFLEKSGEIVQEEGVSQETNEAIARIAKEQNKEFKYLRDVSLLFKEKYDSLRSQGLNKTIAIDLAKKTVKVYLLNKRLSEIRENRRELEGYDLTVALQTAIEYVNEKFPFIRHKNRNSVKHVDDALTYLSHNERQLRELIEDTKKEIPQDITVQYVFGLVADKMAEVSTLEDINNIRALISDTGYNDYPIMQNMLALMTVMERNVNNGQPAYTYNNAMSITQDVIYFNNKFIATVAEHADRVNNHKDSVISYKRVLRQFLDIKTRLEYRLSKRISVQDLANIIHNNNNLGVSYDSAIFNQIAKHLFGIEIEPVAKAEPNNPDPVNVPDESISEFEENQSAYRAEDARKEKPNDVDYTHNYKGMLERVGRYRQSVEESELTRKEELLNKVDNIINRINNADVKDVNEFKKISKLVGSLKDIDNISGVGIQETSPYSNEQSLGNNNYDKTVNNKKEYNAKNPNKDHGSENRVLLNHDVTGKEGYYTGYGGNGTKLNAKVTRKGKPVKQANTLDDVMDSDISLDNDKGEGFNVPPVKPNQDSTNGTTSVEAFYARAVIFSSNSNNNFKVGETYDKNTLDENTLHYNNKQFPIQDTIPTDYDVEFVTKSTPPPKGGLVNKEDVGGDYRHRRVLQDGRVVEMPLWFNANTDTKKSVSSIIQAYIRFKDGKETTNDTKLQAEIKKKFRVDISKPSGTLKAISKFISLKVDNDNTSYKIYINKDNEVVLKYKSGNSFSGDITTQLEERNIMPVIQDNMMNDKNTSGLMSMLLGREVSYKDYMKGIGHTKYHTINHNGVNITFFNPTHSIDISLEGVDTEKLLGFLDKAKNSGIFTGSQLDDLQDKIDEVKKYQYGVTVLPSKMSVSDTLNVSDQESDTSNPNGNSNANPQASRDGTLRIGRKTVVNIKGIYSDEEILSHIQNYDVKSHFINRIVVNEMLLEMESPEFGSYNKKKIEHRISEVVAKHKAQIESHIRRSSDAKVIEAGEALLKRIDEIANPNYINRIIKEQRKLNSKENSYDESPSFKDHQDSFSLRFMSTIVSTDANGNSYKDPFGYPVHYKYSDVVSMFYTAIDNNSGGINTFSDLIHTLRNLQRSRIATDLISSLKKLPEHERNKITMKFSGAVVDRAITIDRRGFAKDADTYGGVQTSLRKAGDFIQDTFISFINNRNVLNVKEYDKFMTKRNKRFFSFNVYKDLLFDNFLTGKQYKNNTNILAAIINGKIGNYKFNQIVSELNKIGYNPHINSENKQDYHKIKSGNVFNPRLFHFTDKDNYDIYKILSSDLSEEDKIKRISNKVNEIYKRHSGYKLLTKGSFAVLDNKYDDNKKPFNVNGIQQILKDLGINVSDAAVDEFFNNEILLSLNLTKQGSYLEGVVPLTPAEIDYRFLSEEDKAKVKKLALQKIRILQGFLYANTVIYNPAVVSVFSEYTNYDGSKDEKANFGKAINYINTQLQRLYSIHYKSNPYGSKGSAKLGDKGSNNYSSRNMITDRLSGAKSNPSLLLGVPLLSNNLTLNIFNEINAAKEATRIDHIHSKVFENDKGKKTRINEKPKSDIEYAHLSLYLSDMPHNGKVFTSKKYGLIKMRSMAFPVMSDKNKAPVFTSPTLVIPDTDITIGANGFVFSKNEGIAQVVVDNIFGSELKRIIAFSRASSINRKAMKEGSRYFYNNVKFNEMKDQDGVSILDKIQSLDNSKTEQEVYDELYNQFYPQVLNILEEHVNRDMEYLLSPTINTTMNGRKHGRMTHLILQDLGLVDEYQTLTSLSPRQESSEDTETEQDNSTTRTVKQENRLLEIQETIKREMAKYVINSMLNYNNIHHIFLGDIAMFSNVSKAKNPDGSINYNKLVYEATNGAFKRWGGAVGTTSKIPNNENQNYKQIILQDEIGISTNIEYLAKLFNIKLTKEDLDTIKSLQDKYDSGKAKALAKKYPKLASHLDITKTDAQEYITWREAYNFIVNSGEITKTQYIKLDAIYNKLSNGKRLAVEDVIFFQHQYSTITNTQKPLGAGSQFIRDESGRIIHISFNYTKSSAVALLPQFTQGTKLDSLRVLMETHENDTGMNVRASYVSTMKADTVEEPLTLDEIHEHVMSGDLKKGENSVLRNRLNVASFQMRRSYWGQQQRFPNHMQQDVLSGEENSQIVLATQLQSLMFDEANKKGVVYSIDTHQSAIDEFNKANPNFPIKDKNNITSEDLERLFSFAMTNIVENNNDGLRQMMGNNWENLPEMIAETLEVSSPGNPLVSVIRNSSSKDLITHTNPKIQQIAHSFIKNHLAIVKTNGLSLVSMSSVGLEDVSKRDISRVVYIKGHKPGPLKDAYTDSNGVFHPAEILIPSHFTTKDKSGNVVVIDLTHKDYSQRDEKTGAYILKEGVIDDRLLQDAGVRLPFSNLNSGSAYKVVGFLPNEMGNTILAPASIIAQKGSDNDGDKEYVYTYNYEIDKANKKIVKEEDITNTKGKSRINIIQNMLLDIIRSIYNQTDPEIQKNIVKPLSSEPIADTLSFLQDNDSNNAVSYLSKESQAEKSISASSGKAGVAYFSFTNIINAMINRAIRKLPEAVWLKPLSYSKKGFRPDAEAQGSVSKAEMISMLQNEAVDNAKNNYLMLINATPQTMPLYAGLTYLGFGEHFVDKDGKAWSGFLNKKGKDGKEYNLPILMMATPAMRMLSERLSQNEFNDMFGLIKEVEKVMWAERTLQHFKDTNTNIEHEKYGEISPFEDGAMSVLLEMAEDAANISAIEKEQEYPGDTDFEYRKEKNLDAIYQWYEENGLEDMLTVENLMALVKGETTVDGKPLDINMLTSAILIKALSAHYAMASVVKVGSSTNKTHSPPKNPGEYGKKLYQIVQSYNGGMIGVIGEYEGSGNFDNMFDLANDILDNTKPNTPEGVRLLANLRAIRDMYRNMYPEYEEIIGLAFDTLKTNPEFYEVEKHVNSILEEYNKYKRSRLFANDSKGLQGNIQLVFDYNADHENNNSWWKPKPEGEEGIGKRPLRGLGAMIFYNRSKHPMWRENRLLNAIALNIEDKTANYNIKVPYDMTEDGTMMDAFQELLEDDTTPLIKKSRKDGTQTVFTPRDVAYMLAIYANFSKTSNNLNRVIPDSFYTALEKNNNATEIDIYHFLEQYQQNNHSHLYTIDKRLRNRYYNKNTFGKYIDFEGDPDQFNGLMTFGNVLNARLKRKGYIKFKPSVAKSNVYDKFNDGEYSGRYPSEIAKAIMDGIRTGYMSINYTIKEDGRIKNKVLLLKHTGNGIFERQGSNNNMSLSYYNAFEDDVSNDNGRLDANDGFLDMPQTVRDMKAADVFIDSNFLDEVVLSPIYEDNTLDDYQRNLLRSAFASSKINIVDASGKVIRVIGRGRNTIDIYGRSLEHMNELYSNDSAERTYEVNNIMRQAYEISLKERTDKGVKEFVNDLIVYRKDMDRSKIDAHINRVFNGQDISEFDSFISDAPPKRKKVSLVTVVDEDFEVAAEAKPEDMSSEETAAIDRGLEVSEDTGTIDNYIEDNGDEYHYQEDNGQEDTIAGIEDISSIGIDGQTDSLYGSLLDEDDDLGSIEEDTDTQQAQARKVDPPQKEPELQRKKVENTGAFSVKAKRVITEIDENSFNDSKPDIKNKEDKDIPNKCK